MPPALKTAWTELVRPLLKRPRHFQVAALCYRLKDGRKEVLLITSRGAGRWIIPKGWPIDGLSAADAALQEAWEEAGVKSGALNGSAIGAFTYNKMLETGGWAPCEAKVFAVENPVIEEDYPEQDQRDRIWVPVENAANMVHNPGLREILNRL